MSLICRYIFVAIYMSRYIYICREENMQGNDVGSQYGSVIFYHTSAQKTIANRVKGELQAAIDQNKFSGVFSSRKISTLIVPAQTFYPATDDHQNYLAKNPGGCPKKCAGPSSVQRPCSPRCTNPQTSGGAGRARTQAQTSRPTPHNQVLAIFF